MGTKKNKNGRDLADTEEIKKKWKKYMEELYKKDLNEPDYYDGVFRHPEPDILECKVRWALRCSAVNKASGCDEIPAELFKSLKDDASRFCIIMSANLEDTTMATGLVVLVTQSCPLYATP